MTIDMAKKFVEYEARMNQSGNIGPNGFNILARQAQLEIINTLVGQIKDYAPNRSIKPGKPVPPIAAEVTSVVTDMLSPIRKQVIAQNVTNGQVIQPSDYLYLCNLETLFLISNTTPISNDGYQNWVQVDDITEGELAYRMTSHVKYPTPQAPIAVKYKEYFQVFPNPSTDPAYPQQIRLTYWLKPADPVWGYTGTGNNIVYDPATSTDFSLSEGAQNMICWKIIELFAISTRDNDLISMAQAKQTIGV